MSLRCAQVLRERHARVQLFVSLLALSCAREPAPRAALVPTASVARSAPAPAPGPPAPTALPAPPTSAASASPEPCSPPWQERVEIVPPKTAENAEKPSPPPERWSPELRRQLAVLRALCAPLYDETSYGDREPWIGCEECPLTPAPSTAPPKASVVESRLLNVTEGSFSKAGVREAIATLGPCRTGRGMSSILLRARGAEWVAVREVGYGGDCRRTQVAGGREVLVCTGSYFQGHDRTEWVHTVDVTKSEPTTTLFSFEKVASLKLGVCDGSVPPFVGGTMGEPELVDLNRDGINDVRVKIEHASLDKDSVAILRGRRDHEAACRCWEQLELESGTLKPGCACPALPVPEFRTYSLEFVQRAGDFVATPATRKVLDGFEASGERGGG